MDNSNQQHNIDDIITYVKNSQSIMTAILLKPKYNEEKGRVTKGSDMDAHSGWTNKKWTEKNVRLSPTIFTFATAWLISLKKLGFYVIDIDVKNGKKAIDVMTKDSYDLLYNSSSYIVESGSGGLHFYFKLGNLEDGDIFGKKTDVKDFILFQSDEGTVDIITDHIISEYSSYEFQGIKYVYKSIKGKINDVTGSNEWINHKKYFVKNPKKQKEQEKQTKQQEKQQEKQTKLQKKEQARESSKMEKLAQKMMELQQKQQELQQESEEEEEYKYRTIEFDEITQHLLNIGESEGKNYDYKKWYEMGQTIKNIIDNDEHAFSLFDCFSQKCRAYDEVAVRKLWRNLKVRGDGVNRTVGSILYLSKQANKPIYEEIRKKYEPLNYKMVLEQFEVNHFYLIPSNTIVEIDKNENIKTYSIDHAMVYMNTWKYHKKSGEEVPFVRNWLEDSKRRMIREFVPKSIYKCDKDEFPIFTHYRYETLDVEITEEQRKDAIDCFNDLLSCVCGDEEKIIIYVRKTLAHLIQKPFIKNGKIIAFASPDEGTGKDTLMLINMKVVGNHVTAHYTSTDQFWDKHDTLSMGKTFIYLEEACSHQNKANEGRLKSRATAEDLSINPKGQTPINVPNIGRIFMTTNEIQPFALSQTDRRGLIIKPSTRLMKQDWSALYKKINSDWFIKSIGEYLNEIDLSGWDIDKDMPLTELKKELQELNKSSELQFLEQWEEKEWVTSSYLYRSYKAFCEENSLNYSLNAKSFGIKILHLKQYYKTFVDSHKVKYYAPKNLEKEFDKNEALKTTS